MTVERSEAAGPSPRLALTLASHLFTTVRYQGGDGTGRCTAVWSGETVTEIDTPNAAKNEETGKRAV